MEGDPRLNPDKRIFISTPSRVCGRVLGSAVGCCVILCGDAAEITDPEHVRGETANIAARSEFVGSISSCFEKHLQCYVDMEERTLMAHVDELIKTETWTADEGHDVTVLTSSTQVVARK
jgi:hypothetical protein